jgi:methionine synthase II (cobalamin-independent)
MAFFGNCRATGIGSLPHGGVAEAVEAVFASSPDLPYWPQLPKVSLREGMNEQAAAGLPGLRVEAGGRLRVVQDEAFLAGVEQLLVAYEAGDASVSALGPGSAAGFEPFIKEVQRRGCREAKGQIAGPITVGMAILGEDGNPILYDNTLREVLVKFLHLRVRWQAERIAAAGAAPVVFVDEPFLASFGTPYFGWSRERVQETLEAVAAGAETVGSHCCSNTDWTIFLGSPRISIVSFDAFEFADNFLAYRDAIAAYLARGGNLAWGIVPTDAEALATVTAPKLREQLLALVAKVEALGFNRDQVLRQSLITPACGLGTRDLPTAQQALELVRDISTGLQREFLDM